MMVSEGDPVLPAKTNVASISAAAVGFLILVAVLGVVSLLVYGDFSGGAASLIGFAIGQLFIWSLLLLVFRKRLDAHLRFAAACLLASAYNLFDKQNDLAFGLDTRNAQKIMAAERPTDLAAISEKYPDNAMLRMIADAAEGIRCHSGKDHCV